MRVDLLHKMSCRVFARSVLTYGYTSIPKIGAETKEGT